MEEKILQTKRTAWSCCCSPCWAMLLPSCCFSTASFCWTQACFRASCSTIRPSHMGGGHLPILWLKVLKPQEALVLTLFGDYIGTLKGQGFYWVNPF